MGLKGLSPVAGSEGSGRRTVPASPHSGRPTTRPRPRTARRPSHRARYILLAVVVLGIALRVFTFPSWGLVFDGAVMSVMGESFAVHGEFLVPYANGVAYYHHYPPLYPMYLSLFYRAFGFTVAATKVADLVLSVLLVVVVYATTANLLGRRKGAYAAAFVALEPMLFVTGVIGYSEPLVTLLYVLTAWAATKAVRRLPYFLAAGVFAGLGFLAKASIGPVFVLALVAVAAWLVRRMGPWVFRDKWFLAGTAAFALIAGAWTWRNLQVYGWPHWGTSAYLDYVYAYGWAHPSLLATALLAKVPWFGLLFLLYGGFFLPELAWSRRKTAGEETSLLWLVVGITFVMGWIVSSFFWVVEQHPLWWWDNVRYVVIVAPVILWLALRETEPRTWRFRAPSTDLRVFTRRFALLMAAFLLADVLIVAFPAPYAHLSAVDALDARVQPGDIVALDGLSPEMVLPYITVPGVQVVLFSTGVEAGFLLSSHSRPYVGFVRVASFASGDLIGEQFTCDLWLRTASTPGGTARIR